MLLVMLVEEVHPATRECGTTLGISPTRCSTLMIRRALWLHAAVPKSLECISLCSVLSFATVAVIDA